MIATVNAIRHRHEVERPHENPKCAMILAAGLGRRMLPITQATPKPLVRVAGRPLIDYAISALVRVGVERIVVNVHHLADQIEAHVRDRKDAEFIISDERGKLLDSGGGVAHAISHFGNEPFYVLNADSFWVEGFRPNLEHMALQWDGERMDALLLLAGMANSIGYSGMGDFTMDPEGRLARRRERHTAPFAYAGAALLDPALFRDVPGEAFSLNLIFDRAMEHERLFGVRLDGMWFHVGTPESIPEAESAIARSAA